MTSDVHGISSVNGNAHLLGGGGGYTKTFGGRVAQTKQQKITNTQSKKESRNNI